MKKLNLGCGQFPKAGYVNVDFDPAARADVHHDLSLIPYPFETSSFDLIEMDHVLEHLDDTMAVIRECHRILKTGGELHIRVPHFSRGFTHWEHKRGFDVSFPYYFDENFKGGYVGIAFECTSMRLTWFAQPWLKREVLSPMQYRIGSWGGKVFDFLGNINPFFTSRLFCYWVGGYEEIYYRLVKQ